MSLSLLPVLLRRATLTNALRLAGDSERARLHVAISPLGPKRTTQRITSRLQKLPTKQKTLMTVCLKHRSDRREPCMSTYGIIKFDTSIKGHSMSPPNPTVRPRNLRPWRDHFYPRTKGSIAIGLSSTTTHLPQATIQMHSKTSKIPLFAKLHSGQPSRVVFRMSGTAQVTMSRYRELGKCSIHSAARLSIATEAYDGTKTWVYPHLIRMTTSLLLHLCPWLVKSPTGLIMWHRGTRPCQSGKSPSKLKLGVVVTISCNVLSLLDHALVRLLTG